MDCLKFTPLKKARRMIKIAEILLSGMLLFISAIGVLGIYALSNESGSWRIVVSDFVTELPSGIDIEWIWRLLVLIVLVTAVIGFVMIQSSGT